MPSLFLTPFLLIYGRTYVQSPPTGTEGGSAERLRRRRAGSACDWGETDQYVIDAKLKGNVGRFLNHSDRYDLCLIFSIRQV